MGVNLTQIRKFFNDLKVIGRNDEGGITRLSYSSDFRQAQELVRSYMEQAGMEVEVDPIGNLIGSYRGKDEDLPVVISGSHLDTVPNGGAFDGALGVVVAVECIRCWHEQGWRPQRTVKVIAFVEEEGTRFGLACLGSRVMLGEFSSQSPENIVDASGHSLLQFLTETGLDPDAFSHAGGIQHQTLCFIELHVEQGAELEQNAIPVGIVSAIVGIDRLNVKIEGKANHAGTTPMDRRQDALVAAALFVSYIYKQASASKGKYVATVGKLNVSPNAENIVPGEVCLTIEIRAEDVAMIDKVRSKFLNRLRKVQAQYNVKAEIMKVNRIPPVQLDGMVTNHICAAGKRLGIEYKILPSWAGHDAMSFAKFVPTGMIFVPSINGISHSPAEESDWDSIMKAAQLLEETLRGLSSC
jgi:hydantoinase/carbamoylase family amidase